MEVKEKTPSKNELIDAAIKKIEKNEFNIYFYSPPMNSPSGGMGVLLRLANTLNKEGYNVKIIYEPQVDQAASIEEYNKTKKKRNIYSKFNPSWLDFDTSELKFQPLGDQEIKFSDGEEIKCEALNLNVEDFLIIPEGFSNIMEKVAQTPCKKIVLAQSWAYVLGALKMGQKWQHFGITDVISVSDTITKYLDTIMPGLKIKILHQGINRDVFHAPEKISDKYPMIAFTASRGPETRFKAQNIIKTFYQLHPHYKWFRFTELRDMNREEFAERLRNSALAMYLDDIAGFGTFPLEAMASNTHVIGWANPGGAEFMNENNGFWSENGSIFQMVELLAIAVEKWVNGELDNPEVLESYEKTLSNYTMENETEGILNIFNDYKNERINEINQFREKE